MKQKNMLYLPLSFFLALAGTGCAFYGEDPNQLEVGTENIFRMPREIRRFCDLDDFSYRHSNYRIIHVDLNGDDIQEIILEGVPATAMEDNFIEEFKSWTILQKAFNGEYVAIGTVGKPVTVRRVKDAQWSELVCYGTPKNDFMTPPLTLYCFTGGEYRKIVELDRSKTEIPPETAYRLLSEKRAKENLCFDDAKRRLINASGDLYSAIAFSHMLFADGKVFMQKTTVSQKDFLLSAVPKIKALDSNFIRMIHAKKVALLLMELGDFNEADELFELALKAQLRNAPDDAGDYADILNNRAVCASLRGDMDAAERMFSETLRYYRMAADKEPKRRNDVASILCNLGILHYNKKDYAKSETELREGIQFYESIPQQKMTDDMIADYGNSCGILAEVLNATERQPEEMFQKSLALFEKIKDSTNTSCRERHAATLSNASEFHSNSGELKIALAEQKRAFEILNGLTGENTVYLERLLNSGHMLAILLRETGDSGESMKLFVEVLKYRKQLVEQHGGKFLEQYLASVQEASKTLVQKCKPEDALKLLEEAAPFARRAGGKAQGRLILAKAMIRYDAEQYETCASELEKLLKEDGLDVESRSAVLYNLGRTLRAMEQYSRAEQALSESLKIFKTKNQDGDNIARNLRQLADVHGFMRKNVEAEEEYRESLAFYGKLYAKYPKKYARDYASVLNNLALLYREMNRNPEALSVFQRILPLFDNFSPFGSYAEYDRAEVLRNIGNLYADTGKIAEAEQHYMQASAIYDMSETGHVMPLLAQISFNLGNLYRSARNYAKAEEAYLSSAKGYHAYGEAYDRKSCFMRESESLNNLAGMLSDLNRNAEAEKHYLSVVDLRRKNAQTDTDRESLARALFNLAWHYVQNNAGIKAAPLFTEGFDIAKALNEKQPGAHDILVARFMIFRAANFTDEKAKSAFLQEAQKLLEKHSGVSEADAVRKILDSMVKSQQKK